MGTSRGVHEEPTRPEGAPRGVGGTLHPCGGLVALLAQLFDSRGFFWSIKIIKNWHVNWTPLGILFLIKRTLWIFRFFLSWNHPWFYHVSYSKSSQNPPPPLNNLNSLSQQVQTSFGFYFNYFISQIISANYFELKWFSKQVPHCLWVFISNQLLWIVLSIHNLEPSWSTPPLFKIFKI